MSERGRQFESGPADGAAAAPNENVGDVFVQELTNNSRRVYAYVFSIVPNASDAEEVYQETCKALWELRSRYTLGTNFCAWAFRIARFRAQRYLRQHRKDAISFTDAFMESIDQEYRDNAKEDCQRHEALIECVSRLKDADRDLVKTRYEDAFSVTNLADKLGRSTNAIYKALNRIHTRLLECIQNKLLREDRR